MGAVNERAFAIFFVAFLSAPSLSHSICLSETCEREAKKMLSKIDDSVGICEDFFDFACGKYKPELPSHKVKIDELSLILDTLQERLNEVMRGERSSDEILPFQNVKVFYQNCMNTKTIEKLELRPIKELLILGGGWPVTIRNWDEESWSWQKMVKDLETIGFPSNFIFELSLSANQKNTSTRILGIDQPALGLNKEYLSKGLDDKLVKAYHSYQIDTAVIYGADRAEAEREMKDALDFEISLANISLAREDRRNGTKLYNPISLKNLQQQFPSLNWVDYFNTFLLPADKVAEDEIIIMTNATLFKNLYELLDATPKRIIANYMMWRMSLTAASYLHDAVRDRALQFSKVASGKMEYEPRWKECVAMTANYFPIASGALYVRKFFDENSKETATEMVNSIKNTFEEILNKVSWMDDKTRTAALSKVENMAKHIGYPDELMDDKKLIEFYKDLHVPENEYLKSVLKLNRFRLNSEMRKFHELINKTHWESHSDVAIANAYYSWHENSILIPAGILQGQFFSSDRPRFMNYASIGYVIGHEITHGFDDQGRQFDSDGNLVEWWEEDTKVAYLEKARCIIEQYGNFTEPNVGLKLNGINTQGENIADNGGLITAYRAYQKWVELNGMEEPLPGLYFTPNQLFWISAAQTWCSAYRLEEIKMRITTGVHSVARYRVIGPLSNIREFSEDFKCPEGSPMNPTNKCKVW